LAVCSGKYAVVGVGEEGLDEELEYFGESTDFGLDFLEISRGTFAARSKSVSNLPSDLREHKSVAD